MDPEAFNPMNDPRMKVVRALSAGKERREEKEKAFKEYSEKRVGKDFWKPDITLRIEDDMKTDHWKTIIESRRGDEEEDHWYEMYSFHFDEYMRLPDKIRIEEFKQWFNVSWGQYTPSKKLFEKEVINNFPRFAFLASKHDTIRGLIEKFKVNHPVEFLSLKKSYIFDMIFNNEIKEKNDKLRSAYSEIMRSKLPPDEGYHSATITDEQWNIINREFFNTKVYSNQSGGKSKKTRRSRRKLKKTRRIRRPRK